MRTAKARQELPPRHPPGKPKKISIVRQEAAKHRWESVKEDRELWVSPFHLLAVEKAMVYLEDLRNICEEGGHIMNNRINRADSPVRCSGPHCGKDLSGKHPNGMPLWIGQKVVRDGRNPEIKHVLYFCSTLCDNDFVRASQGAHGTTGQ